MTNQLVSIGDVWEHHSGHTYIVVAVANTTAEKSEYVPTVCYRSMLTNEVYARPMEEFLVKMKLIERGNV